MNEVERLRAALQAILAVNEGDRVCAYSWGQEFYKRSFDIAAEALSDAPEESDYVSGSCPPDPAPGEPLF